VLAWWEDLQPGIELLVQRHAKKLEDSHRRVRLAVHLPRRGLSIKPHLPPDILGVLVLLPVPKGISR